MNKLIEEGFTPENIAEFAEEQAENAEKLMEMGVNLIAEQGMMHVEASEAIVNGLEKLFEFITE